MMSGKLRLLPSELGRLVLGYLKQHDCHDAAENFLKELPELGECLAVQKLGRPVCTTVGDRSLEDMMNDYADAREQVQNSLQQHPGVLRKISKSWDLNQQLMEITKIATEKSPPQDLGMLGRKSANTQIVRTRLLNKQLRNTMVSTQTCCDHCSLRSQESPNPLLDVSTTSIKDLPGSLNHSSSNHVEDNQILLRDLTVCDNQDSPFSQKDTGILKRIRSDFHAEFDSQLNIETSSSSQELGSSNISSSSIDATPQKRKGNQVKRRSHGGQTGPSNGPVTVEEDVHFEIMLKKLMEDTNLHEKIAENINRGLNTGQSRSLELTSSQDENCSSEALIIDGSKVSKPGNNSTFPFELDSIITNIVSETTDSPNFESILEEVFGSSLQKCTNMNSEEIQNELSKLVARPLSTPVPQSQSAENSTNQRISTVYKENNQNQEDKMCDAKKRMSSQIKNNQYRNEVLSESINTQNDNENLTRLALNKTKKLDTDDIPNTDISSRNENSLFHRSEMNVPHKLRHKLNRKSASIQVNSSSCATSHKDHLLIGNSQLLEKNETNNENMNSYIAEKKYENSMEKNMKHTNDTEDIKHVGMQSKDLGISKKSIKNQNCENQMSPKISLAEIEKPYQVDEIDNEIEGSKESLDESYRISDISNIPITSNKNKSKTESEVIEPVANTSKSLLQNISSVPQENIFTVPDNKDVNDNTNKEIISNNIEVTTNPSADIISRNTTPIKSMTIPGIATSVHVKQVESPYKIVERNDSTLTEMKSMRSDLSSSAISVQWPPTLNTSLNIEDDNLKPANLDISNVSITNSKISNVGENNINVKSSKSTSHIENSFSRNYGIKTLAPVQIIPLPMNVGRNISSERYRRIGPRSIAPRPIAPRPKNKPKNQDGIEGEAFTPDTPIFELPIDTLIYPATKDIMPAPVTTYKLPNNIVFTIPNIPSVKPIPDPNVKIASSEENKRNSPSKKKSPKSPIRGRSVNMTRVKPKTGVGKAGKRKLRNLNNLENISKTNDFVSAAVTLLLSPSHTKTNSPFKQVESPTDGKFNDSLIKIIQDKANTLLNDKEIERNLKKNDSQLGSVSPKLKELLEISKNLGSDKKITKCSSLHKSPISKGLPSRGSQSTPSHKNSHIRALDFGTPGKDISPRKWRRQQVMQSLNFSPSLRFKKTMKNSSLDASSSVSFNKFSPKKRILERIQEETNNSVLKEEFMDDKRIKENPMPTKKPRRRKNKPSVREKNVDSTVSEKSKNNIIQKVCSEIMKNPLSSEHISNSVNEKVVSDSSNKDLILETPIKTNEILTLELATPYLKSFKKICDNNDDLNTPFPKISEDHEQNRSPKIGNDITMPSDLSTHYQPGVQEQDATDFCKTVSHTGNIKNSKNHHKEEKKEQKRNINSKNKVDQKKKTEKKMGRKIEEEIASRFGNDLLVDNSMKNTNLSKLSCLQNHDVNSTAKKEIQKSSGKYIDSKYIRVDQNVSKYNKCIVMEKDKITPRKGEISPKRITRSAKKLENSLCIQKEEINKNFSSSQKKTNDNENQDKSNEHKKGIEKVSHKLTEQHCKKTDLQSTEIQISNKARGNLVIKEKFQDSKECRENLDQANGSEESSGESSKWHIDDELPEIKSMRTDVNIEDQGCSEFLQCENMNSEIYEKSEYYEDDCENMSLCYSEFIDLFSINLTNKESSQKKLNKRLWVEGSSEWSPKRKRPRMIRNQGRPMTHNQVESPTNKLQKIHETLIEEERTVEMGEVTEQYITPVRGSVSERSVGSSVSSSSPGRLVILQSPYWMLDENVMTPNQSIACENKEDCSQSNKSSPIEGVEKLASFHHKVTVCLKCNKEAQNSQIYLEKEDHKKGICVCESLNENQKSSTEEGNCSSESSNQNQKRSKKSNRINKVLVNGGTLEIAQSPTKQMAIVTEPQISEMQVSSIDSTNDESNASIIPPTPGKNLDHKEHGISSSSTIKSQVTKPSNTMKNNLSNNSRTSHSDESEGSVTLDSFVNSSADGNITNDGSENQIYTNIEKPKPKKKLKVMKKMNIEEFLKNIHK